MALERASVSLILFSTVNHTFKVCFTHMFLISTFFETACQEKPEQIELHMVVNSVVYQPIPSLCPCWSRLLLLLVVLYIREAKPTLVLSKSECLKSHSYLLFCQMNLDISLSIILKADVGIPTGRDCILVMFMMEYNMVLLLSPLPKHIMAVKILLSRICLNKINTKYCCAEIKHLLNTIKAKIT